MSGTLGVLLIIGHVGLLQTQATVPQPSHVSGLTDAEKLYGLSLIWKEADYNFAFFDQVPKLDWDRAYRDLIPQVLVTENTLDYYRVLQRFVALLEDGHSRIYFPDSIAERQPFDVPWIAVREVQHRPVVVNVEVRLADRLPIGSEITHVEGVPVSEYLEQRVFPYVASAEGHARWRLAIRGNAFRGYGLLVGPANTPVRLTIHAPDGDERELTVIRDRRNRESEWVRPPSTRGLLEFRWLQDSIAYVGLNSFNDDALIAKFDSVMPELSRANGVVLDIRRNGGGRDAVVHAILSRLTQDTLVGPAWRTRVHNAAYKAWGRFADDTDWAEEYRDYYAGAVWHESAPDTLVPDSSAKVTAPVVVLIGERTESAAENFLVYLDSDDRFTFVGQPTVGSTGQPLFLDLPGGGRAWIVTKRNSYPDGRDYVGVGVQPDVYVEPTVDDYRAGRDAILDSAVRFLRAQKQVSSAGLSSTY
jgi:C-terminal processing protease CtpA/Prc